jgi:membrane-associated phospholipid phosphatase
VNKHVFKDYSTANDKHTSISNDPIFFCKTVKALNDIVLENNFPPMIASRNYAYASIAAYECMVVGNKNYTSLATQINGLKAMPMLDTTQVDFNLAALFSFIKVGNNVTFPEGSMMDAYNHLRDTVMDLGISKTTLEHTIIFSDSITATIMAWSKKDNYAVTRSAEKYTVLNNDDSRWIPTPPAYAQAIEYHWMDIRTLTMDSAAQFKPIRPPVYNIKDKSSEFYKRTIEVKNVGEKLTDEQKHIANFFDDNPFKLNVSGHVMFATKKFSPPGHWMNIVGIAAEKSKVDFATTVCAYTQTAIALFDGFISCWDEKYRSNLIRPETVINKYVSPDWRPFIQTPPFPSYTSGHSVISAAASEVMTHIFGENFTYRDSSEREFGVPDRTFTSFKAAANEASISRLYGGIHYRFDIDEGAKMGEKLGKFIVSKLKMKCLIPCLGG